MKKEFVDTIIEVAPVIFSVSIAASFLKGAKTVVEYFKALLASYLVGLPAACITEYFIRAPEAWMLKYAVVLALAAFGICVFNGLFKIFKHFEEHPEKTIDEIKRGVK